MRPILHSIALVLFTLGMTACASARFTAAPAEGFRLVDTPEGRYYAYVPKPTGEKLPVILFLHGGDERGSDPLKPTQVGLGPYVSDTHGGFPFIVLFPQCPSGKFWAQPEQLARLTRILDDAVPRFGGDVDRVYLTGPSMGGYGTWLLAAEHPERFAAIAPICGGVKPPRIVPVPKNSRFGRLADPFPAVAKAIGSIPTWAFHGEKDWVVSPVQTQKLVAALRANGNDAKLTMYPGVGHHSWDHAYADPALFIWLAAQKRATGSAPTPASPASEGK